MSGLAMSKIELPRQDHYDIALKAGIEKLKGRFDAGRLRQLGAEPKDDGVVQLASLCWRFAIRLEPFSMVLLPEGGQASIVWRILALEYLNAEPPPPPARFVSFADFPDARSYLKVFDGRVSGRLSHGIGKSEEEFILAAHRCGGTRCGERPLKHVFRLFPQFELLVVRHEGDEDFPPSCNVLFPDNALDILSAECIIVAAERLVASLAGKNPCD